MNRTSTKKRSWQKTFRALRSPKVITLFFLGFSAGLPILLIFSSLSLWLREAGVVKSTVTFFSWAALSYSFKFIWAPLIDQLPLPYLTRILGRRRSWLLVSQLAIIVAIVLMAVIDPAGGQRALTSMAIAAVMLGFSSATQDIVIDAYRIECAEESIQALLASMYIMGYRIGMLVAGAGALFLADYLGSSKDAYSHTAWEITYLCMAGIMCIGLVTTLCIGEVKNNRQTHLNYSSLDYGRFLLVFVLVVTGFALSFFYCGTSLFGLGDILQQFPIFKGKLGVFFLELLRFALAVAVAALVATISISVNLADRVMVRRAYLEPVQDFFTRYGVKTAVLFLILIGFYRISDIVLGVVANVFYQDIGFSKNVIASVSKSFGVVMTVVGALLGGILTVRFGVRNILFLGAFLSAITNLLFMLLAQSAGDISLLAVVIVADNLSGGIATTAFVAFLSSLTSISFTAVQYTMFSSTMTLMPKLIGGYSGTMVMALGYEKFFLLTAIMGIPILFLIMAIKKIQ